MNNCKNIVTEPHFLPNLAFFCQILPFEKIMIEQYAYYVKQTYRNRSYVLGANKVEKLTIPVLEGNKKRLIKDIKIDNSEPWQRTHWRTITAAYQKSPFFEFYADYFHPFYTKNYSSLIEYDIDILSMCLKLLQINKTICLTKNYELNYEFDTFDARGSISPKNEEKIAVFYKPMPYYQNFGNEFVPNLSVIDLFFCKGPESLSVIKNSVYI